jgi:hypothetical protein
MSPAEVINPPPANIELTAIGLAIGVILTTVLLIAAKFFDHTAGTLTISIMIVLGMLGATAYCLIFTIPTDDITPGVVGGLTAGFGAVIAHWFGRVRNGGSDK